MIDIKGLDKAVVLQALYDASHVQGMGIFETVPDEMVTVEHCRQLLAERAPYMYFDYLHGKVMKVDLSGDEFDERLYDRDNGRGAARRAIDRIRVKRHRDDWRGMVLIDTLRTKIAFELNQQGPFDQQIMIRFGDSAALDTLMNLLQDLKKDMEEEV